MIHEPCAEARGKPVISVRPLVKTEDKVLYFTFETFDIKNAARYNAELLYSIMDDMLTSTTNKYLHGRTNHDVKITI